MMVRERDRALVATPLLVFDRDGVLIDSEPVKRASFEAAVAETCRLDEAALAGVSTYNAASRGVPRDQKIAHVLRDILKLPESLAPAVAACYARKLAAGLPSCAPVRGVSAFLSAVDARFYVASSAPEPEIRSNLERHDLLCHFAGIFGHPLTKAAVLSYLRRAHAGADVVFFGDAVADLEAAEGAGVRFVAVNPNAMLRLRVSRWVPDFHDIDQVLDLALGPP